MKKYIHNDKIILGDKMERLFETLKINPKNLSLYSMAFSHSSYVNEVHQKKDYERLEFLGDKVVDLAVSDYLFRHKNFEEGDMTKIRASYVCENALFEYARDLNLSDYIKVGHGEEKDGGREKKVILADIFEALMGAIYIDQGYEVVKDIILNIIVPYINDPKIVFFSDYKSVLQEYVQTEKRSLVYELVDEMGPPHDRVFTMNVRIDDIVYGTGMGSSKKEAEQNAARNALSKLAINE